MEHEKPELLPINTLVFGRSMPTWHYTFVPQGMRPATLRDLTTGKAILHKVRIGPHAGDYYTDYIKYNNREAIAQMIRNGEEVYVAAEKKTV